MTKPVSSRSSSPIPVADRFRTIRRGHYRRASDGLAKNESATVAPRPLTPSPKTQAEWLKDMQKSCERIRSKSKSKAEDFKPENLAADDEDAMFSSDTMVRPSSAAQKEDEPSVNTTEPASSEPVKLEPRKKREIVVYNRVPKTSDQGAAPSTDETPKTEIRKPKHYRRDTIARPHSTDAYAAGSSDTVRDLRENKEEEPESYYTERRRQRSLGKLPTEDPPINRHYISDVARTPVMEPPSLGEPSPNEGALAFRLLPTGSKYGAIGDDTSEFGEPGAEPSFFKRLFYRCICWKS